jgi:single-strand DNA-binding protein
MSSLNSVVLIGRLTRDPEFKSFASGGGVCKIGLAVNERKKNRQTGEWEDDPMFIDVEVFDRGENGKAATNAGQRLVKGNRVAVEGRLVLESWDDKKTGAKRYKHKIIADRLVYIDQLDKEVVAANSARQGAEQGTDAGEVSGEEIPF